MTENEQINTLLPSFDDGLWQNISYVNTHGEFIMLISKGLSNAIEFEANLAHDQRSIGEIMNQFSKWLNKQ